MRHRRRRRKQNAEWGCFNLHLPTNSISAFSRIRRARRSTAAERALAGERTAGGRPVRAQFGRRHREPAAVAVGAAHRSELGVHVPGGEHAAGALEGEQLRHGSAL